MLWEGRVHGTAVPQICFRDNQFDKKRPCLGSIGAEQAHPLAWSHLRRLLHGRRVMSARSGKWNVRLGRRLCLKTWLWFVQIETANKFLR